MKAFFEWSELNIKYDQVVKLGNFPNFRCTRTRWVEFVKSKNWDIFLKTDILFGDPA